MGLLDNDILSDKNSESNSDFIRKAIFIDIDGTLVRGGKPPSHAVVNEIRRVRRKGHLVFICTGRVPCHIQKDVEAIGFDGVVASGGAYVAVGDRIIYEYFFNPELVVEVAKDYDLRKQSLIFEGERDLFTIHSTHKYYDDFNHVEAASDFEQGGKYEKERIYKFCSYGKISQEFVKRMSGKAIFLDNVVYHEIVPASIGKSVGIKVMLDEWGVSRENSIAIGDSSNDIDMLKFAGLGIAMGDALEHVRSMADKVTAEFHKDGVAVALKTLFP